MKIIIWIICFFIMSITKTGIDNSDIAFILADILSPSDFQRRALLAGIFAGLIAVVLFTLTWKFAMFLCHKWDELKKEKSKNSYVVSELVADKHMIKKSKQRFCRFCGNPIDLSTKKCSGCGKQYFRMPSIKKRGLVPKVIVVLSFIIIGLCVYRNIQYQNQIKQLHAQIAEQSERITALQSNLESAKNELQSAEADTSEIKDKYRAKFSEAYNLAEENEEMKDIFEYCKKHMVFVPDDNTRTYHRYSCLAFKFSDSLYGIYSADTARAKGFTRCSLCFN